MLAAYDSAASSYQILSAAKNVVIFNDPKKAEIIKYVHIGMCNYLFCLFVLKLLACSFLANDPSTSNDQTRLIMVANQFVNDTYRLHCCLLSSGHAAIDVFRATSSQKFFMRQIKGADSVIQNRAIKGAANLQKEFKFKDTSAILLTIYGHMLLMTRSYSSSLSRFFFFLTISE